MYRFLTSECGVFLSSFETMTIWHLRDLVAGLRTKINSKDIKVIQIPYYEGLYMKDLWEYAESKPYDLVMRCFPSEEKEINKLPRAYFGNVIYTRVGDEFKTWVNERIRQRNAKLAED